VYRTVYWTDLSPTRPAIYRSSVINPARETVISGGLLAPTALAIDFTGIYRIYRITEGEWAENHAAMIQAECQ